MTDQPPRLAVVIDGSLSTRVESASALTASLVMDDRITAQVLVGLVNGVLVINVAGDVEQGNDLRGNLRLTVAPRPSRGRLLAASDG
jgi:hypothetical protein